MGSFSPSSLCSVPRESPFRITMPPAIPSKRSGFEPSLEVESRSSPSLVSSRKGHTSNVRVSEEGNASDVLRCLFKVGTEEAGGEVVSEFEVEGNGEGVDVDVVMARVWAVADVATFEDED